MDLLSKDVGRRGKEDSRTVHSLLPGSTTAGVALLNWSSGARWAFAQLEEATSRGAQKLHGLGLGVEDPVPLWCGDDLCLSLLLHLCVLKAGAATVFAGSVNELSSACALSFAKHAIVCRREMESVRGHMDEQRGVMLLNAEDVLEGTGAEDDVNEGGFVVKGFHACWFARGGSESDSDEEQVMSYGLCEHRHAFEHIKQRCAQISKFTPAQQAHSPASIRQGSTPVVALLMSGPMKELALADAVSVLSLGYTLVLAGGLRSASEAFKVCDTSGACVCLVEQSLMWGKGDACSATLGRDGACEMLRYLCAYMSSVEGLSVQQKQLIVESSEVSFEGIGGGVYSGIEMSKIDSNVQIGGLVGGGVVGIGKDILCSLDTRGRAEVTIPLLSQPTNGLRVRAEYVNECTECDAHTCKSSGTDDDSVRLAISFRDSDGRACGDPVRGDGGNSAFVDLPCSWDAWQGAESAVVRIKGRAARKVICDVRELGKATVVDVDVGVDYGVGNQSLDFTCGEALLRLPVDVSERALISVTLLLSRDSGAVTSVGRLPRAKVGAGSGEVWAESLHLGDQVTEETRSQGHMSSIQLSEDGGDRRARVSWEDLCNAYNLALSMSVECGSDTCLPAAEDDCCGEEWAAYMSWRSACPGQDCCDWRVRVPAHGALRLLLHTPPWREFERVGSGGGHELHIRVTRGGRVRAAPGKMDDEKQGGGLGRVCLCVSASRASELDLAPSRAKEAVDFFRTTFDLIDPYKPSRDRAEGQGGDSEALTYGEIELIPFLNVLESVGPPAGGLFVDLGSGTGKAVVAAAMSGRKFNKCLGIELLPDLIAQAGHPPQGCATAVEHRVGDILRDTSWLSADCVYVASLCFDQPLLRAVAELACGLKRGGRILTLQRFPVLAGGELELLWVEQMMMSWGLSDVYVYERV